MKKITDFPGCTPGAVRSGAASSGYVAGAPNLTPWHQRYSAPGLDNYSKIHRLNYGTRYITQLLAWGLQCLYAMASGDRAGGRIAAVGFNGRVLCALQLWHLATLYYGLGTR